MIERSILDVSPLLVLEFDITYPVYEFVRVYSTWRMKKHLLKHLIIYLFSTQINAFTLDFVFWWLSKVEKTTKKTKTFMDTKFSTNNGTIKHTSKLRHGAEFDNVA